MMLLGMGSARDSSDMDTAAAVGARARAFEERGQDMGAAAAAGAGAMERWRAAKEGTV